ncbi:unnamed protein product [Victoria cruziana]
MFFTGDSSTRKRVDMGGRSSKERDRQKLLEQARLERKRRLGFRQQTLAAVKIQKWFRGRKSVKLARLRIREELYTQYGDHCQKVERHCFCPDSDFLLQLLFIFNARDVGDFNLLVETCRLLRHFVDVSGNMLNVFGFVDFPSKQSIIKNRVKRFALACVQAIHQNRDGLKDQLFLSSNSAGVPSVILLETVASLIDSNLPWVCKVVQFFSEQNAFSLLRDIVLTGTRSTSIGSSCGRATSLEHVLTTLASHVNSLPCTCPNVDPQRSFPSQVLTIPFLWKHFPHFKKVFTTQGLGICYIRQMASFLPIGMKLLPNGISKEYPSYACLLGNTLEVAGITLSQANCTFETAMDFAVVLTFWLESLPVSLNTSVNENTINSKVDEDGDINMDEEPKELILGKDLEQQISDAIDSFFLKQLVNNLLKGIKRADSLGRSVPDNLEIAAVGAVCALLHVTFTILPLERIMTGLAYNTDLVPILWNFMKRCHESQRWPSLSELMACLSVDAPGWLLPLSVFSPVYRHMLMITDNEEFYEHQKPLSLQDVKTLIIILKEALWHLLWVVPVKSSTGQKLKTNSSCQRRLSVEFIQTRVGTVTSELLAQLQDWNSRRQFTSPDDFHAHEAISENFFSQVALENTRANNILKQAPFLVPFTSRVRIYTSQVGAKRQSNGAHSAFTRHRFRIRRDRIVEDAFSQLSLLSEKDLKGMIRVTFVNEFGVEEAGIDGGGIFKDFMENITRAAFDVQYGLFKETSDHMLYPNPASGMIHEQHLQYFRFLGTILGKAMFEGILVDIPFATFFLSKLKQKHNYLNDLPSLDPELYRHLLFLKHYKGDICELGLYFVVVNNEYGEQTEEELLPGGKDLQVTNENVITFIHLVANHRLNIQIRQQSSNFLQGFQQLIQPDWISMFNEHELQLLISGSLDGMDVDDLCSTAHYAGGYHEKHPVIEMFWEVLKGFSPEQQKKFLKFVTGCSRGPLLGFKYLEPRFCIQRAALDDASEGTLDRLPTSATCMNLLKLPPYKSKEKMEMKLVYAINADAGFDLS